jgi:hypothetical protein
MRTSLPTSFLPSDQTVLLSPQEISTMEGHFFCLFPCEFANYSLILWNSVRFMDKHFH